MELRQYRTCLEIEDYAHQPLIFGPIDKDKYEDSKVVQCNCDPPQDKLKYQQCAPKCNTVRIDMISFDFLSPTYILAFKHNLSTDASHVEQTPKLDECTVSSKFN